MSIRQKSNNSDFEFNDRNYIRRVSDGQPVFDIATGTGGDTIITGAKVTTSETAPTDAGDGDLWYDETTGGLYVFTDAINGWIQTNGGGAGGDGGTGGYGEFSQFVSDTGMISPAIAGYNHNVWTNATAIPNYDPNSMYAYWVRDYNWLPMAGPEVHLLPLDVLFVNATELEALALPEGSRPTTGVLGVGPSIPVRFVDQHQQYEIPGNGLSGYEYNQGAIDQAKNSWGASTYMLPTDRYSTFDTRVCGGYSANDHGSIKLGGGYHEKMSSSIGIGVSVGVRKSDGMVRVLKTAGSPSPFQLYWFKLNVTELGCLRWSTTATSQTPTSELSSNQQSYYHHRWNRTAAIHGISD